MAPPLEDYALIGNTHTAALVARDGSIDWLCMPRFDSGATFAALLGGTENGCWRLFPAGGNVATTRRYLDDSLVLQTRHRTSGGTVTVTDFMPAGQQDGRTDLMRLLRGESGRVTMRLEIRPRFDYGRAVPWMRRKEGRLHAIAGPDALVLTAPVPVEIEDAAWRAAFTVEEGESLAFSLTWHESFRDAPPPLDPPEWLETTLRKWRDWAGRCTYRGPWREAVMRSLIVLKALTHHPTGGIVAAPTTSLPETPGGQRNWDYRFCWLRDATFTLYALLAAGYHEEAAAWREWLLRAVAGEPSQLQIMYGLGGERRLEELTLPWLRGYAGSRPVRVGNDAHHQLQLDVFGEIMDSLHVARKAGLPEQPEAWKVQKVFLDFLESHWCQPDEGLWEVRGGPRPFTHSKVMAWVAVDRAVKSAEAFGLDGPIARWRALRRHMHQEICRLGYDAERNSFVQFYGGKEVDAALLLMAPVGFLPPSDPRIQGTVDAIRRDLLSGGLVRRYIPRPEVDGLPPGEGCFLACSFWLADNLALQGRQEEARQLFENLLALRNDLGLLAEEYDPVHRRMVGNFPQAFSHVALVNTVHNLTAAFRPAQQRASA